MRRLASLAALAGGAAALIAPPVSVRRPARTVRRADWQRYEDAASGDPYWHDADSGETTWDDPNTPVVDPYADWQAAVDPTTPPHTLLLGTQPSDNSLAHNQYFMSNGARSEPYC